MTGPRRAAIPGMAWCSGCQDHHPFEDFGVNRARRDGRQSSCRKAKSADGRMRAAAFGDRRCPVLGCSSCACGGGKVNHTRPGSCKPHALGARPVDECGSLSCARVGNQYAAGGPGNPGGDFEHLHHVATDRERAEKLCGLYLVELRIHSEHHLTFGISKDTERRVAKYRRAAEALDPDGHIFDVWFAGPSVYGRLVGRMFEEKLKDLRETYAPTHGITGCATESMELNEKSLDLFLGAAEWATSVTPQRAEDLRRHVLWQRSKKTTP